MESSGKESELPILPNSLLDNIKQSWIKLGDYFKNDPIFNKNNVIENIINKKSTSDMKIRLNKFESKLHKGMMNRVENMVKGELVKTAVRTSSMILNIVKTTDLIKKSKEFRESPELQVAIDETIEYLDKAQQFYRTADNEIIRIQITSDIHIEPNILVKIALDLNQAKFECVKADQNVKNVLNDINQKMKSLLSTKKDHLANFATSVLDLTLTIFEYVNTPSNALSGMAKMLFATNAGVQTLNTIGHSIGFYWTQDEIIKLEENQHVFDELKIKVTDSFDKIYYGMEKLEKIKQYFKS
jgi:hypothetical protein